MRDRTRAELRDLGIDVKLGPGSPLLTLRGSGKRAGSGSPRRDDEHRMQVEFFAWVRRHESAIPALRWCFAVPNGGARSKRAAGRAKAEGVRRGVLDILVPVGMVHLGETGTSRRRYVGCALEMKTATGRLTPEQEAWRDHLTREGWRVHVCRSAAEARAALCAYLGVADPEPQPLGGP